MEMEEIQKEEENNLDQSEAKIAHASGIKAQLSRSQSQRNPAGTKNGGLHGSNNQKEREIEKYMIPISLNHVKSSVQPLSRGPSN